MGSCDALGSSDPFATYTRSGAVPFTIGQSASPLIFLGTSAVLGHSVVVAWHALPPLRRKCGSTTLPVAQAAQPGTAVLGTFHVQEHGRRPLSVQLTLADVQNYYTTQPINFGISSYNLKPRGYIPGVRAGQHSFAVAT